MTNLDLIVNTCAFSVFGCCAYAMGASRLTLAGEKHHPGAGKNPERIWFTLAYSLMAIVFATMVFYHGGQTENICWLPVLVLVSSQAILIGYGLISMANPHYGTLRVVSRQAVIPAILMAGYLMINRIYGAPDTSSMQALLDNATHPAVLAWAVIMLWAAGQIVWYTILFFRELAKYRSASLNYFSDVDELRFVWIRGMFWFAIGISVLGVVSVLARTTSWSFAVRGVLLICYMVFSVRYVKYVYQFPFLETVTLITSEQETLRNGKVNVGKLLEIHMADTAFFTTPHITIDDVALRIGVGRTLLSNYLNRELGVNFTTWICSMRVEYAKHLITFDPSLSVSAVAEKVGFTETTNFVRKFKQLTEVTPLQWKKTQNL